jgi:hypothetical protein
MTFFESSSRASVLLEHDLFRKPVATPDQVRVSFFKIMLLRADDDVAARTSERRNAGILLQM